MAISDLDRQLLLIARVGDIDSLTADPLPPLTTGGSGIILQNAERIWNLHIERRSLHPFGNTLFDYYFMRTGVQLVIGVLESRVDFSAVGTAMSVKLNQRIAARLMQSERYIKEIMRIEQKLQAFAPAATGLLTTVEIVAPPKPGESSSPTGDLFRVDAADPRFAGSPYWPSNNSIILRR